MISPLDGFLFNFGRPNSNIAHVFSDSIGSVSFKVKRKKIIWDRNLFGKILYQDKDSLILVADKNMRVKFVPLRPEEKLSTSDKVWNHEDWKLRSKDFSENLKLLQDSWNWDSDEPPKICLTTTFLDDFKNSHTEKWNFRNIEGNHLFVKTYGQFDKDFYKVKKYLKDTVFLQGLSYYSSVEEIKLIKIPSISEEKKNSIQKRIKGLWKGNKLIKKTTYSDEYGPDAQKISGFYAIDTTLFKQKSLENQGFAFHFKESYDYEIYESDTLRLSGKWKISDSGKQIVLNSGYAPENYIDIIELSEKSVTIGKIDRFQVGNRTRDYVELYYLLELKK